MKFSALLFSLSALLMSAAHAADKPESVTLCYESEDIYPWVMKDRPGLNNILLGMVESKLGVKLNLVAKPWKRCQEEMREGKVDGIYGASYKKERLEMGHYPMSGDKLDEKRALMYDGYTLYRVKGNTATQWDGKQLTTPGAIGAQLGYSIIDQLKQMGVKVDDGAKTADDNLRKLLGGRVDAVALQTLEGNNSINAPEFAGKVEKMSPSLVDKPFYLMLSKQFVAAHSAFSETMWNTVAAVRESPEYKAKATAFR